MPIETSLSEFAVVGGGPAGSTFAALMARQGREVSLFERDTFPRNKLCGEFLSSESQVLLNDLGCLDSILRMDAHPIVRTRFTGARGQMIEFLLPGTALGISRRSLDEILFRHAQACGAQTHAGINVISINRSLSEKSDFSLKIRPIGSNESFEAGAQNLVAAYGRRSRLDQSLQRTFLNDKHPYVGFKQHHRIVDGSSGLLAAEELKGTVEVHTFKDGYCGMCFIEQQTVNVCMLLNQHLLSNLPKVDWENLSLFLSSRNPLLAQRLKILQPLDSPMQSVAQVPFVRKEKSLNGILFIGDAAGMISPLCGDGQAMAIESAFLLAELFTEYDLQKGIDGKNVAYEWERRWRQAFQQRMIVGYSLQKILFSPWLAQWAARTAQWFPMLPPWLAKITRGATSPYCESAACTH